MTYTTHFAARKAAAAATPQLSPIAGREAEMARNGAGGMVFAVGAFDRLRRFLILGSDTPTYYADGRTLTLDNIGAVLAALDEDGLRVVSEIVSVSDSGRAPRNDPALYALALAASYGARGTVGTSVPPSAPLADRLVRNGAAAAAEVRRAAFEALPRVARTGTHLMQFVGFLESLRGWGRGPRGAVARWLGSLDDEKLALQAVKYRQRNGWTMRDILRLAHPEVTGDARRALVDWIAHRALTAEDMLAHEARLEAARGGRAGRATPRRHEVRPASEVVADARSRFRLVDGYHLAQEASSAAQVARVIRSHGIPHECVPSEFLKDKAVWDALLDGMPPNALVRNLNRMTACGLLVQGSAASRLVADRLTDETVLRKARVHPFKLLVALRVYQSGHGLLGDLAWTPAGDVVDALDAGFYAAFGLVRPTGKRFMLGLDVSGSMGTSFLAGAWKGGRPIPGPVSARTASAAMAMVTMAAERSCFVGGFTAPSGHSGLPRGFRAAKTPIGDFDGFSPLDVTPRRRLDDIVRAVSGLPFGGTDAALPIAYATEKGLDVDAFVIYTDNETWAGKEHVTEALRRYRDRTGIPARLVAVGMTATEFSVVDPTDPLQLNVVGFDGDAPSLISDFVSGDGGGRDL